LQHPFLGRATKGSQFVGGVCDVISYVYVSQSDGLGGNRGPVGLRKYHSSWSGFPASFSMLVDVSTSWGRQLGAWL